MNYYYFCPKLKMWYVESYLELSISKKLIDNSYAIYPKRFYKNINLNIDKKYDFIFIGSFSFTMKQIEGYNNRKWIIDFAKKKFTDKSLFINTTNNKGLDYEWTKLGTYDKTLEVSPNDFMCPKYMQLKERNLFDKKYFDNLSQSKFCLCPAGDCMYSMRFYECLMCKCIPIVSKVEETYRSEKESKLDYKYYLSSDKEFIYREDWVEHNYNIFLENHTLEYFYPTIHLFGMRRSRLHLICDVVQQNYKKYRFYNNFGGSIDIKCPTPWRKTQNSDGDNIFDIVMEYYKKINKNQVIILFEDKVYNIKNNTKTLNIILIRDIYDVITSRLTMRFKEWIIDEVFIDTYKKLLKEVLNIENNIKNKLVIDTDKFIKDKKYCNNLFKSFNIKNYNYTKEVKRKEGGGKTFQKEEDRQNVKIPLDIYNLIKNDNEFIDLIYKYYKYDLLKKLRNHLF